MKKKTNTLLVGLGLIMASILVSGNYSVESVSAYTASIITNNSIELDITPNGNGTSIHSESINVQSDCRAGYNLTIATPEGSNLYKYENNTQSSNTASFTAVDGTSALSSSSNTNKWGYTLTSNPNSSTVFSPLSSTASVLKTSSQTASPEADINDTFNINYGAKVDNTVEAGTYQMANDGAIVYYLTMDTTCTQYTVSFNPNGGTGTMDNQGIEAGEPTNLSANDFTAPAFGSSYEDANGDTIVGTANTYWRFNGWNTAIDGTGTFYNNEEEVEDLVGAGSTITLYAQWEALSTMVVNFNTNGMEFEDGTSSNTLGYYHGCRDKYVSQPSYSHTANINDDGTQIGSTKYANNLATKDVITIPNADSLHVTIKYGTENSWDMLYVFQGEYTGSVTRNMNAGQLATYMGGGNTTTTVELDIPGDTATFAFYSDSSGQYWGYHATVVGYYDEEPESYTSTVEVCDRSFVYGEYKEPAPDDDRLFQGWSENSSATTPDYTSADDILNNLPGGNGDTKTLYAIWNPVYHITYVNNCQTYISGNEACTADVSSGTGSQNINLDSSGDGSTTLPAYNDNSWTITGWKIKGWSTVADNSSGANTEYPIRSVYSVTGQSLGDGITLYAHWIPAYTVQYDGNGASNPNGMGTTASGVKSVRQTNVGEGEELTLLPNNYRRSGYGFAGWSTDSDAWSHFADNDSSNDSAIYGPMEAITMPSFASGTTIVNMYAVWVPAKTSGGNPVYLQDFSISDCAALTKTNFNASTGQIVVDKNSVVALTDKRDNKVYTIAKLADNNCWMVENLKLDSAATLGNNINDSTVTNRSLSQGYGGTIGRYGSFVGLATSEADMSGGTRANSIYNVSSRIPVNTYDPINDIKEDIGSDGAPYRFPRYHNKNNAGVASNVSYIEDYSDPSNVSVSGTYSTSTVYSYGYYYSGATAMANTSYISFLSNSSEDLGTSICPAGWHLPSGGGSGEHGILSQSYGGNSTKDDTSTGTGVVMSKRLRAFPNNYLYSGIASASDYLRGSEGDYWSRSSNVPYSELLNLTSTSLNTSSSRMWDDGSSIRCLINTDTVEITLDSNDGTGYIYRLYGTPGNSVDLPQYVKENYKVGSWNTSSNGSGSSYAGSYNIPSNSNGVTLYAQWIQEYIIQYDGNGADNPNGMGTTDADTGIKSVAQVMVAQGDPVTLLASNFKKSGYGFVGWSTDSAAWSHFTDNNNANDPIIYGPHEMIEALAYPSGGIMTLYAVWVPAKTSGGNPVYLQDFDTSQCAALTSTTFDSTTGIITANKNGIVALTDKRDNQVYAIARLVDGNCWMIENLRLEHEGTVGQNINDSSVTNESLSQGYGKYSGSGTNYGDFIGLPNPQKSVFNSTAANSIYYSGTQSGTATINIGTSKNPGQRFPRYGNYNTAPHDDDNAEYTMLDGTEFTQNLVIALHPDNIGTYYDNNLYSYGNVYSWAAANANTNPFTYSSASDITGTSICPFGWHLPSASSVNAEFSVLSRGYGGTGRPQYESDPDGAVMSSRFRTFPNNFLYSGGDRGRTGLYWSRSVSSDTAGNYLFIDSATLSPYQSSGKAGGHSVRCLVSGS